MSSLQFNLVIVLICICLQLSWHDSQSWPSSYGKSAPGSFRVPSVHERQFRGMEAIERIQDSIFYRRPNWNIGTLVSAHLHPPSSFEKKLFIILLPRDSVSSVGLIEDTLPFASSNSIVRIFRHALALDEHRTNFKANQYHKSSREEANRGITDQTLAAEGVKVKDTDVKEVRVRSCYLLGLWRIMLGLVFWMPFWLYRFYIYLIWLISLINFGSPLADVGGGSGTFLGHPPYFWIQFHHFMFDLVANGIKPCLARISLRWMIRECFKTNTGILFNTGGMKEIALDPASLSDKALTRPPAIPIDSSYTPKLYIANIPKQGTAPIITDDSTQTAGVKSATTEEEADLQDSLAPIYDQLSIKKIWWILEFIPFSYTYQDLDVTWVKFCSWNLGRGRLVGRQGTEVNLHRTVKTRMDAAYKNGQKYQPRVRGLDLKMVTWADWT